MKRPTNETPERTISLSLNQQQFELLDRTIARGTARSREELVLLALSDTIAKRAAG